MKILVPIKHVVDANVRVQVKSDGSGVETANVKHAINPFCEIAVEEAVKLKESGTASEIVLATVGPATAQESLRKGLAMGADRAVHVTAETAPEPLAMAKILKFLVEREQPGLVLLGKQSIDGDNNQTGQMLAALLGWAQGTFASHIELAAETATVTRETDDGLEKIKLKMPAVLTADLRLNTPRNVTLPNLMKAKQKPIEALPLTETGVDSTPRLKTLKTTPPAQRSGGVRVATAAELVEKLRNEAKVI